MNAMEILTRTDREASYAWCVDRDFLADADGSRLSTVGPRNAPEHLLDALELGDGIRWRTRDDDGNLVHQGRWIDVDRSGYLDLPESAFGPLDDLSGPDAGATSIEFLAIRMEGRHWATL